MTFEQSIEIAAAPADLFALTQDYGRRLEWDPFLKSAVLLDGATEAGVGVRACCVAHSGLDMETEYVSFNPPRTCAVKWPDARRVPLSCAGSAALAVVSAYAADGLDFRSGHAQALASAEDGS